MRGVAIALDWRFEALHLFSKAHLQGLRDFHALGSKYSEEAIVAWEQACEGVTGDNSPVAPDVAEQRSQIDGLLATGRMLGILGLYAFLENYMNLVIEQLRAGGALIPKPKSNRNGFDLHELRKHFRRVGIDLEESPFPWNSLNQMREVRNCIAHADSWISEVFAERLNKVGLSVKEDTQLGPPEADFERWWRLVRETCRLIHSKCSDGTRAAGSPRPFHAYGVAGRGHGCLVATRIRELEAESRFSTANRSTRTLSEQAIRPGSLRDGLPAG